MEGRDQQEPHDTPLPFTPSLSCVSSGAERRQRGCWLLERGVQREDPGREQFLAGKRRPEVQE